MTIREQFPNFEDIENARRDELAEVACFLADDRADLVRIWPDETTALRSVMLGLDESLGPTARTRRAKGGQNEHGETMINNAFNEKTGGPLVDFTAPESEQRALRFLMVGSNGLFRNPRGYRDVELDDPKEAAELLIVASHLLRMVESRAATR